MTQKMKDWLEELRDALLVVYPLDKTEHAAFCELVQLTFDPTMTTDSKAKLNQLLYRILKESPNAFAVFEVFQGAVNRIQALQKPLQVQVEERISAAIKLLEDGEADVAIVNNLLSISESPSCFIFFLPENERTVMYRIGELPVTCALPVAQTLWLTHLGHDADWVAKYLTRIVPVPAV